MLIVRPARFADALELAGRLRCADAQEIASSWGVGAKTGLFCCLLQSDRSFAVVADGEPIALCGISDAPPAGLRIGVPWLLAADELFTRRRLARQCRDWVRQLLLDYDVLTNLTDAGNAAHRRWLAWCGFVPLRVHERYGAMGQPFEEFYLLNERHTAARDSLHQFLLHRPPPPEGLILDAAARRLVDVAVVLLGGSDLVGHASAALAHLLDELNGADGWGGRFPPRTRLACARLVLEIARRRARPGRPPSAPLDEFYVSLVAVADVAELLPERHAIEPVVGALGTMPRPMIPSVGVPQAPGSGVPVGAFDLLARRYLYHLTEAGRWPCLHAYRVRAAGLGLDADRQRPLGVSLHRFDRRLRDHLHGNARLPGGTPSMAELSRRRLALLQQPLSHGRVMGGMLGAFAAGSVLGRVLDAVVDERGSVPLDAAATVTNVAEALSLASALADRIAARLLPSLRLGVVVTGYGERHWLYRCLRARLLEAAGCNPRCLSRLLRDDVTALLLAARFESALLDRTTGGDWLARLAGVASACLAPFGPEVLTDDDLGYVTDLLTPVVATPVAHALHLGPALAVWQLAANGSLTRALADLSGRSHDGDRLDRAHYRRALRRLVGSVDVAALEWRLGAGEPE
jgi:hypothetical protein